MAATADLAFSHLLDCLRECHERELRQSHEAVHALQLKLQEEVLVLGQNVKQGSNNDWKALEEEDWKGPCEEHWNVDDSVPREFEERGCGQSATQQQEYDEDGDKELQENCNSQAELAELDSLAHLARFQMRALWLTSGNAKVSKGSRRMSGTIQVKDDLDDWREETGEEVRGCTRHFIAYPGSSVRMLWDMLGGLLILYDFIMIPLRVFDPPENSVTRGLDWVTMLFWTANIFSTLTMGYVDNGTTVMEPQKIFRNYMMTWFWVDFIVLTPDWLFELLAVGSDGDSIKVLRTFRLARCVRLLRLVKLRRILEQMNDLADTEYSELVLSISKMMAILLTISHIMACLWYAMTTIDPDATNTWVHGHGISEAKWSEKYLISLHWSLTQFTPATMQVQPQNSVERLFAVSAVIFALVGFAYFIGGVTGSLAQMRSLNQKASKEFWLLRRYLRQHAVPRTLSLRIQRFLEHAYRRQSKTMAISQVGVMSLLSGQLMAELQSAINLPHVKVHPLFKFLSEYSFITMNKLAKEAVGRISMARGDTLFLPEQCATAMYFVGAGRMFYTRVTEGFDPASEWVDAGEDWLGEPVLWTVSWHYVGEAMAHTDCELLAVTAENFVSILSLVKPVAAVVAEYGRNFIAWMQKRELEGSLSDIIQGEDSEEVLWSFIPEQAKEQLPSKGQVFSTIRSTLPGGRKTMFSSMIS